MIYERYIDKFDFCQDLEVFTENKKFIFEVDLDIQTED